MFGDVMFAAAHPRPHRIMQRLLSNAKLLCSISFIFAEFHGSATAEQRVKLPGYGLREDEFEALKRQVHSAMETPGCRLSIYWRSFWASCGDKQRFEWRDLPQART